MKKLLLFAAVAGLGLVSASPPDKGPDNGSREARRHYPPCSRTVTDSCIQLHERGVRARHHREQREHAADHRRDHADHAAADHHRDHARDRHRHHASADHRDHAGAGHHRDHAAHEPRRARSAHATARAARVVGCRCHPPRRQVAHRIRRAGERG